jgi:hypothetical protein
LYALTLHAGNNLIQPFTSYSVVHLYAANGSNIADQLAAQLKLESAPEAACNLLITKPYYRDSAFFGSRVIEGLSVVSDLQLYLDLKRFPIRGVEASEYILERRLKPLWSHSGR